ncbi:MFS transporter, partial [Lactobacillus sp. XV13L]|nr:MFS transporter [Lactobacillus sp. XV13L]
MSKTIKIISLVGLTIAMFMGTLDSTIVNIALPEIMHHFNASLADTSWITTAYTLALAVFMITGSKIADYYGRKKLMLT